MSALFHTMILVAALFLQGANCDLYGPCLANTTNCPPGKLCYGDCPPYTLCTVHNGVAYCGGCVVGWIGMDCEIDADECTFMGFNPCDNDGVCVNTVGSYTCTCATGWTGRDCTFKKGAACGDGEFEDPVIDHFAEATTKYIKDPTAEADTLGISHSLLTSLIVISVSILLS